MAMKSRQLVEIEWTTPGETVEGWLLSANKLTFKDGGVNVAYLVKTVGRGIVSFPGTSMLNKLLHASDVGCLVRITYRGVDGKPVAMGMSPKKIFEVEVDEDSKLPSAPKEPVSDYGDVGITDADIPF